MTDIYKYFIPIITYYVYNGIRKEIQNRKLKPKSFNKPDETWEPSWVECTVIGVPLNVLCRPLYFDEIIGKIEVGEGFFFR